MFVAKFLKQLWKLTRFVKNKGYNTIMATNCARYLKKNKEILSFLNLDEIFKKNM